MRNVQNPYEQATIWLVTGSQHLYGDKALKLVAQHACQIGAELNAGGTLPVRIEVKPVVTRPEEIEGVLREANADAACIGVAAWMHTFSPARMWIAGLQALRKPLAHLHTQFNRDIPWATIDMEFMNINQSAHGDREFGYMCSRMGCRRKVIAGHWHDRRVQERLGIWMRAAAAWQDAQGAKIARFGDNMREVAVTEGDKVEAQLRFGYAVNGFGVGDLVARIGQVSDAEIDTVCREYDAAYRMTAELTPGGKRRAALRESARIEIGLRGFLQEGGMTAFTDTFENLHGLRQLPGLAVQRLMAAGYGFGAEGDWKQAALVRALKVMGMGMAGGASFMEDYTYHFDPGGPRVLGAHMLEVCPSIAAARPACEISPLGIGGKDDPVRLVFDAAQGPALNATVVDLGSRFRMIVNTVEVVASPPMPMLPVARVLWNPQPDLVTASTAWILAGGAHHTAFSQAVPVECLEDFCEIGGVELLVIDRDTRLRNFRNELRWNEASYR